ncbi:hypothetical protein BMS3Abin07_01347 [bacterium BMS3Abin07]|nr:hypothetical protein BMS3Abin07_01347 [bacterium BMS3Abin07]GBE32188.1 hypothetical protein BMS3Bbin05_01097 [bacterium BMS3Bbin05]
MVRQAVIQVLPSRVMPMVPAQVLPVTVMVLRYGPAVPVQAIARYGVQRPAVTHAMVILYIRITGKRHPFMCQVHQSRMHICIMWIPGLPLRVSLSACTAIMQRPLRTQPLQVLQIMTMVSTTLLPVPHTLMPIT